MSVCENHLTNCTLYRCTLRSMWITSEEASYYRLAFGILIRCFLAYLWYWSILTQQGTHYYIFCVSVIEIYFPSVSEILHSNTHFPNLATRNSLLIMAQLVQEHGFYTHDYETRKTRWRAGRGKTVCCGFWNVQNWTRVTVTTVGCANITRNNPRTDSGLQPVSLERRRETRSH